MKLIVILWNKLTRRYVASTPTEVTGESPVEATDNVVYNPGGRILRGGWFRLRSKNGKSRRHK